MRTILQKDPIGSDQEAQIRMASEEEADQDEAMALKWARERYALLLDRLQNPKPGVPLISRAWVILAEPIWRTRSTLREMASKQKRTDGDQ